MGSIGWLLLIPLGPGWLASEVPLAETHPPGEREVAAGQRQEPTTTLPVRHAEASMFDPMTAWRRTRDGWERPSWWTSPHPRSRPPALHPIVVGLLEIFLASAALIAFSDARRRPGPKAKSARWPNLRRQ